MSSTSDQMTQPSKKTRLIIDEIGVDTETGIIGRGHSCDNGKTFTVDKTIYGRIFHKGDYDQVWKGIQDKVKTVVEPAKSAADSAVSAADDAVASAQVTSDAVSAIASATAEAKAGANDALSQAESAWDVATKAKSAVTDFDPLLKSAQSDASKALAQIADTANALSDAKTAFGSGVAEAKQLANTAQTTADSAIKSASNVANDLTAVASQAKSNADGITKVTSDVGLLQTTVADNSGNISTIQETAKQIQQAVSDNAGNITVAKQTADSAVAVASDAKSNATVAIQTASQASITASNASGQAASAVITANGAMTTASDAKSNATVAVQTASGASLTATNAKDDATIAKQTASEAKVQASNAESDFAQISIRAGKIEASVANNSGAIASVQQTANGLTTTVGNVDNRVKTIEDKTNWTTKTGALDMDTLTTTQNIYYRDSNLKNADGEAGWAYIQVVSTGERVTQTVWHDRSSIQHTRTGAIDGSTYDWDAWNEVATNAQVVQVKNTVDGISNTINDPKTGLNATYQTAAGNSTTISNVKSDVYQLQTTANGLTSRVGNLESKTNTQETAIEQNKNAIALKADQTAVDTLKGTVSQNTATLKTQASQIQEKVTSSQVTGMLAGYATQDYTQSLVTQKADDWNLNLTRLQTDVNAIKTTGGGVNLLTGTSKDELSGKAYWFLDYQISGGLQPGTTYTLSGWARVDQTAMDHQQHIFVCAYTNDWSWSGQLNIDGSLTAKYNTATFTTPSGEQQFHPNVSVYLSHPNGDSSKDSISGTGYISKLMLEKGTVAHDWSPAPSDLATVTSVTNLSATVDGIQAQVYNSDGTSKITQLSNLIQSKVGIDDFNNLKQAVDLQTLDSADINDMKTNGHYFVHNLTNNPIGGWVYVDVTGDGGNRIRQDVYQDIGNQHKFRRWFDDHWLDWEEGATYTEINQLKDDINLRVTKGDLISQINLQAGTALIQSNKLVLDAGTTVFTGDAFIPSAAISSISADKIMLGSTSLYNSDGTMNLVNTNDGTTSKITVTQGSVNFDGVNKTASIIRFASDNNTNAFTVNPTGATVTPTLFFERFDQPVGHWLGFTRNSIQEEGVAFNTWDNDGERFAVACHARFEKNLRTLGTLSQGSWDGTTAKPEAGVLTIKSGNTIWSGSDFLAVGSNVTGTYTGIWAKSFSQQSTLSSKTNIETVNPKDALDLINKTDIRSYQYKSDVAEGHTKRYTSLIIDDVNDVSQYYAPDEFINEERTGRDDGSAVGYLFLAVQELTRRIKTLEDKLNG